MNGWMSFIDPKVGDSCVTAAMHQTHNTLHKIYAYIQLKLNQI